MSNEIKAGTAGGTLLTIGLNLQEDIFKTALLAAVGASLSFVVSLCLKLLFKWIRK